MSAQCLFDLLLSLEGETQDTLDALELVKAEKPLRSLGKSLTRSPTAGFIHPADASLVYLLLPGCSYSTFYCFQVWKTGNYSNYDGIC